MFSQFSVRRPYTVFVAVCLILVLGIISFVNMSTDLLPNIELPYIVVMTSYPGASPEQVELAVTRPLEAALGTAGGLKNVNSVSRENSSMIMLEFVQTTNMDSAMIELSNSIDMLSARLDSAVSKPMLVRINPDMMPIMVATVDMEGKDTAALSDFVTETVMPRFERIEGVASVTPSGLLEKEMRVVLNQAKIDTLNHSVLGAVDQSLNDTKAKLLSAQKELDQALAKLSEETVNQAGQMAEATVMLDGTIARLQAMLAEEAQLLTQQTVLQKQRDMLAQMADLAPTLQELFPNGVAGLTPEEYAALLEQLGALLPADLSWINLGRNDRAFPGRDAGVHPRGGH
jgi:multidrug efflux pump subunit AcrB